MVLVVDGKNVLKERSVQAVPADKGLVEVPAGVKADDQVGPGPRPPPGGEEVRPEPSRKPGRRGRGRGLAGGRPVPRPMDGTGPALVVTAAYQGASGQVVEARLQPAH